MEDVFIYQIHKFWRGKDTGHCELRLSFFFLSGLFFFCCASRHSCFHRDDHQGDIELWRIVLLHTFWGQDVDVLRARDMFATVSISIVRSTSTSMSMNNKHVSVIHLCVHLDYLVIHHQAVFDRLVIRGDDNLVVKSISMQSTHTHLLSRSRRLVQFVLAGSINWNQRNKIQLIGCSQCCPLIGLDSPCPCELSSARCHSVVVVVVVGVVSSLKDILSRCAANSVLENIYKENIAKTREKPTNYLLVLSAN